MLVAMMALVHLASSESVAASCATGRAVEDAANNLGLVSDCDALLVARDTLAGSATLNWSVDSSIADWEGVILAGSPLRVTKLTLGSTLGRRGLAGEIPPELGSLANLVSLNLFHNDLGGGIPAELASLSNLQSLDLSYNGLTGEIPPELGSLANLVSLNLSHNQLSGGIPAELRSLTNLHHLGLAHNQLSGCIPEELRDVASNDLEDLDLPFCDVLLSGLNIDPGTLTPPFDSYHTDYATVVGQSRVTVTPTNDHNASFQFLDEYNGEIADADGSLVGHQIDLGAGVTTVRIRVISPDSRAIHTYTIVDLVGRYDANDDGAIDRDETLDAIDDYLFYDDRITRDEVLEIIGLYLFSAPPTPTPTATPVPTPTLTAAELVLRQLQSYAWVQGSVSTRAERAGFITLRYLPTKDVELARLTVGQPWVEDGITLLELFAITSIDSLADVDLELAKQVFEEPFMAPPFRDRDAFAIQALASMVSERPETSVMALLADQPWFIDGLDDQEAALLRVIGFPIYISDDFRRALIETHHIASASIQLPLSGEIELVVVRHTPFPPDDYTLAAMEEGVRASEAFMGEPFPYNDVILVIGDSDLWPGPATYMGGPSGAHIRVHDPERYVSQAPFKATLYHEIGHFYISGSIPWLFEGGADFLEAYTRASLGEESLEERLASLESSQSSCLQQTIQEHIDNYLRSCAYVLGERFLLTMYAILGHEGASAALREARWERGEPFPTEEAIYDTYLKHTPPGREDEFRDAYRRLHGPIAELSTPVPDPRSALVSLYDATGRANWEEDENWLSDHPLGEWHGVRTDVAGRVIELQLGGNQMSGEIPPALGGLTNLLTLDLFGNRLSGEIPSELGKLTNLHALRLMVNQLTGVIPAELGKLTNLRSLDLSGNQLSGEIPPELVRMTESRGLYLSGNQLTGVIPAELGDLTTLRYLYLRDNQLTGDIPPALARLTNLRELDLSGNQLTGVIPAELGRLTNFHTLRLTGNQLTGVIPAELGDLTTLRYLYLRDNQLTGDIPPALGRLTNLVEMDLSGNQLTGVIPAELGDLTDLGNLYLRDTQLTGDIPPALGRLTSLLGLYLSGNQLTGDIPAELGDLTTLRHLDLRDNQLTGDIPAELGRLTNLYTIRLSGNRLTGCIPGELRNVHNNDFAELGLQFCGAP